MKMKLSELSTLLNKIIEHTEVDLEVGIVTKLPYPTIGSHPMTAVKSISAGFDWDHGMLMIWPESNLAPEESRLKEMFDKLEKVRYKELNENRELKRQIKELEKKLEAKE
jgi:hypothetical protein